MRIATIERFSDPSRRTDPRLLGDPGEVETWDLPNPLSDPLACVRQVPRALGAWVAMHNGDRGQLLRACLATGGARVGALLRAPELLERVRRGDFDAVGAFSSKHFGLAQFLARETGGESREMLGGGTQYFGEFAFELLAVIPYAYWLHSQGLLKYTVSAADTRALYYFSPRHEERNVRRSYVPITEYPIGERGSLRYDRKAFPRDLDTSRWLAPPYAVGLCR